MGLLKRKGRSEVAPSKGGSSLDPGTPMGDGDEMAETAQRGDELGREAGFPTALRLATEPVADGTGDDDTPAADTYGLRAELEAQRRKAGESTADEAPAVDEPPAPEPETVDAAGGEPAAMTPEPVAAPEPELAHEPAATEASEPERPDPAPAAVESVPRGRGQSFVEEARARLEALERSLVEKTDALRQRAGEIAEREEALTEQIRTLDELESTAVERQQALESRETELVGKLAELEAEAERLEEEQAIWGEAAKESKTRLSARETELETRLQALDAREQVLSEAELALETKAADLEAALASQATELEATHAARLTELEAEHTRRADELAAARAEVDERGASLVRDEADLREREASAEARETALAALEQDLDGRTRALAESEAGLEAREAAAQEREAGLDAVAADQARTEEDLAGREEALASRDADLAAREQVLAAEAERLERERGDWDGLIHGAFDRLNELETDLVSSLSLAGMLKRELEGREGGPSGKPARAAQPAKSAPASNGHDELAESRSFFQANGAESTAEPEPVGALPQSTVAAENPDEKATANDWWARQLGRRKKD